MLFGIHTGTAISRMEYIGGSVTSPTSYEWSIIDQGYGGGSERYDFFQLFNIDADADLEILYGMGYGGDYDIPMIMLDRVTLPATSTTIANARVDGDVDYVPDSLGVTMTVVGTVTSANDFGSSTQFYHYIDDGTAGILVGKQYGLFR